MAIPTGSARTAPATWLSPGILSLLFLLFLLASPVSAEVQAAGDALRILRISPAGEDVPPGRQLIIEFDRPVVPLGRMERKAAELPITIEPQLNCQWRWLNGTTLACYLNERDALRPATDYRVTIRPGIIEQATLAEPVHHRFLTERPRVTDTWFRLWLSPSLPRSMVRFNLPMARDSLRDHLLYRLADGRRIAARVEPDPDSLSSGRRDDRVWLVSPESELPAETPVELAVEPGILTVTGGAPGIEQRVLATMQAIPEFRFLGVGCPTAENRPFHLPPETVPDDRSSPGGSATAPPRCPPSGGVSLLFSAPVLADRLKNGLQLTPPLQSDTGDDPWDGIYSHSRRSEPYQPGKTYSIDLPESVLRPNTAYLLELAAGSVTDEFGRPLTQPARASFATDHRAPDFALVDHMVVLEKGRDADAQVLAVNLKELRLDYQTLTAGGKSSGTRTIRPQGPEDATIPVPLAIRSLLGRDSGLVQGSFVTEPVVAGKSPEASWFFAQVTPFQVHLKLGHHNSLAWITDLATGEPVADVEVRVIQSTFRELGDSRASLAAPKTDGQGIAMLPGTATLDPRLAQVYADGREQPQLFLLCRKAGTGGGGGDMAVLPLRPDYQITAQGNLREHIPEWPRPLHGHIRAWGTTAQGIYRTGDLVQYKIFVRDQNNLRFTAPPGAGGEKAAKAQPRYRLQVLDPLNKEVFSQEDITLSAFGTCHGQFTLAGNAAAGWYRFLLTASFSDEPWEAMRVLVSDFSAAPFRVTTRLSGQSFGAGDRVAVTSEAAFHAGGAYSGAATQVTATLDPLPFTPDNPALRGFTFADSEGRDVRPRGTETLDQSTGSLDARGRLASAFTLGETPTWFGRLTVESAVRDDRGKSIASRATATYFGRDRYVGLLQEDWTLRQHQTATVRLVVVDRAGRPVAGVPVKLTTEQQKAPGAGVRGTGDASLGEDQQAWAPAEEFTGLSAADRPVEFSFTPAATGRLRLVAAIADTAGRPHVTVIERWVTGKGPVPWESSPGSPLNVYPEKSSYRVGETARFLVENPFPGARALVTVERFGIIDHWTTTLADSSAVVEVPVRPDYLPGFYLSVTVAVPRVEDPVRPPDPQGKDPGRPTWRMGYATIPVTDSSKELTVQVRPAQELYKPGDTVRVELQVRPSKLDPGEPSPPVELAVAVLDEAVFDLLQDGSKAFDPYRGFYSLDPLDLRNYNLLMEAGSRDRLALKEMASLMASPGGGSGEAEPGLRGLFRFVSYWNPSLAPDAEGRAAIEFQVPDNLTGWKVLAMAVSPEDRMGLGEGGFKVNQATEIRPTLPNQVLEGDTFSAGFTLMNRTDRPRKLEVVCRAEGPVQGAAGEKAVQFRRELSLAPDQRTTLFFPIQATAAGTISLIVTAGDTGDRDGLTVSLPVGTRRHGEVVANYGMTGNATAIEPILYPEMGKEGGEFSLLLSPSVIGGIDGSFSFLRDYPYSCWEQKLSRGVMAALYGPLRPYLPGAFSWPDSDSAPGETLALAAEFQAPNGGMTFYQPRDEYVSPYLSAFTALAFNRLRQEGYQAPGQVEQRLQDYLQQLLRQDRAAPEFSSAMSATVRAVALAALAERGRIELDEVLRHHPQLPVMSLFGKALYLRALLAAGGTLGQQWEVLDALLAQADRSSGQVVFRETLDPGFSALLSSPARDNGAILGALLAWVKANPADSAMRELAVNLMRTISQSRKTRSHWPSTQENLFMAMALADYARLFEQHQPDMQVSGRLNREPLGAGRFTAFTDPPLVFTRAVKDREAGRNTLLHLEKIGDGKLYYTTRLAYSPRQQAAAPVNAGIEVHREYRVKRDGKWQLLPQDMAVRTGEVVKVDLYASLPAERYFVVLEDPVPGGLEPVNKELATSSHVDAADPSPEPPVGIMAEQPLPGPSSGRGEDSVSRWSFYHRELRHDVVRFYSERLAAGRYHLNYTAQAIAPGKFTVQPAHAEEMYAPEVHGNSLPARLAVTAAP